MAMSSNIEGMEVLGMKTKQGKKPGMPKQNINGVVFFVVSLFSSNSKWMLFLFILVLLNFL